ncbi:MAG: cytochrome c [Gemmatimonadota bacterium]|nr:cytochrome c [Gemmatimonadota bacterium]
MKWLEDSRAKRFGLFGGVVATALLGLAVLPQPAAGNGGTHETPAPVQAAKGKEVYDRTCAACHQGDGSGVPGTFPPVAKSEWVTGSPERLVRIILHGVTGPIDVQGETYKGTMPPWGSLSNAEVAAVSTYIRSNFGNKAPAVTTATVARIRTASGKRTKPWTVKELMLTTEPAK